MSELKWHSMTVESVIKALETNPSSGLTKAEAERRLAAAGRNELAEQAHPGFLSRLANQFKDVVVLLLIGAALISALLGEWPEAIAIILIVVLNAILGVVQEGRAEAALEALKKMSAPEARVIRGGRILQVPEAEVVPGDIVLLEAGNYIPADLRLIETVNLRIDESSLTGESVAVEKDASRDVPEDAGLGDRKTMAYKSTIATYGRGRGVVVATGMQTEIGKIAEMLQSVEEEETPLQLRLNQLGSWLAYGSLIICGVVFLLAFGRAIQSEMVRAGIIGLDNFFRALNDPQAGPGLRLALRDAGVEAFLTAVALAVAAVPEGLPAIVTINLALGMREMVARNALIRRLPAVETLGSASAICSDKTGTLTQNEMTAIKLYVKGAMVDVTGRGYTPDGRFHFNGTSIDPTDYPELIYLLRAALLASDAMLEENTAENGQPFRVVGDPTEGALVVAAAKANLTRDRLEASYPRIDELPFDSTRKRMSTLHLDPDGHYVLFLKGAPDIVLELCTHLYDGEGIREMTPALRERVANINRDMAQQALRVLAVAERRFDHKPGKLDEATHEKDLTFIGLIGMIDPARPEVKPAIERARHAGIKTVMVTGDYPDTARAIAREIGLIGEDGQVITGRQLETMSDEELRETIEQVDVFARVSPEHKVRIVDAFRKRDHVVAMTGDGVNDAPALKRASIGVAMGITGTDVSKETADMVLTDDNYVSIVNAVEQGRIIYDNIRKFVYFLLSCNLAEIMVIFLATLAGFPSPLTPIQLLWLNLLTDGAPALALGVEKGDPDVMDRKPRPVNEPIIDRVMRVGMVVQTIFITAVTLGGFLLGLRWGGGLETGLNEGRSMAFVVLSFSELIRAYTTRSEYYSVFKLGVFSNKFMQYAVGTSIVLLLAVIYIPFLNPVFDTIPLGLRDWAVIAPLILVPSAAAEITKMFLRMSRRAHSPSGTPAA
ncbi:MAG: calcium-transporting P-type ATPase, PMR1-type [Anaerolineae bacterium]